MTWQNQEHKLYEAAELGTGKYSAGNFLIF